MSLDVHALTALADDLAERTHVWKPLVVADPAQRHYVQLADTDSYTAWLICWMPGHDTGWHDHDGCAGAVRVLQGAVTEQRLAVGSEFPTTTVAAGAGFVFEEDAIHRVTHADGAPAVTLHVYSPPLGRYGSYIVDANGRLRRQALGDNEELKPLART